MYCFKRILRLLAAPDGARDVQSIWEALPLFRSALVREENDKFRKLVVTTASGSTLCDFKHFANHQKLSFSFLAHARL